MDANLHNAEATENTSVPPGSATQAPAAIETGTQTRRLNSEAPKIPAYLRDIYYWAYMNPRNVRLLDRELVVSVILWGQHKRLQRTAFAELSPGQRVLQPASVYGDFSRALARHLGPGGRLEVTDILPIQVASCRRKLRAIPHASARLADARHPGGGPYDAVCCYFLMHELPEDYKRQVVSALLSSIVPGGKVVFIDYHKPHWGHPLKGVTSLVFDTLEPFAKSLWRHDIAEYASHPDDFGWRRDTYFGGLFQKVVATRPSWT